MTSPPTRVPVEVASLKHIKWALEKVSKKVHSDPRIILNDKKFILGELSRAKKLIDEVLQLSLFSAQQLDQ